jgi:hypothetical protein
MYNFVYFFFFQLKQTCVDQLCDRSSDHEYGINTSPSTSNAAFIGRQSELEAITSSLKNEERDHSIDVTVTGTAGIGKSKMILQFIKENKLNFKNILWLQCEKVKNTENEILKLARMLKIIKNDDDVIDIKLLILDIYYIINFSKTLIVFDNVLIDIYDYLPPVGFDRNNITIIITSQYKKWESNLNLPLQSLPDQDCIQLLQEYIKITNLEEAKILIQLLGNNPLAIKHAISYMYHNNKFLELDNRPIKYSINSLLIQLRTDSNSFIKFNTSMFTKTYQLYSMFDLATVNILQYKLGELALNLLSCMSILDCKNITTEMFHRINFVTNPIDVSEAMLLLENYSLITIDKHIISISPLVQAVIRSKHKEFGNVLEDLLSCFMQYTIPTIEFKFSESFHNIRLHIIKLYEHCSNYDSILKKYRCILLFVSATVLCKKDIELNILQLLFHVFKTCIHMKYLHFHCIYLKILLDTQLYYDKVVKMCDLIISKLGIENLEKNVYGLRILLFKSNALYYCNELDEAWLLAEDSYKLSLENCDFHVYIYETLELMTRIACKCKRKETFNRMIDIIKVFFLVNVDYSETFFLQEELIVIKLIACHYVKNNKVQDAVDFIRSLKTGIEKKIDVDKLKYHYIIYYLKHKLSHLVFIQMK